MKNHYYRFFLWEITAMSQVTDFILNGVLQMETLLGNPTFTYKGETFACIPNTLNDAVKSNDIGYSENEDFRMTVRLNQFTPNIYPDLNEYITYQGEKLLIQGIKKTPHGVFWVYICNKPKIG